MFSKTALSVRIFRPSALILHAYQKTQVFRQSAPSKRLSKSGPAAFRLLPIQARLLSSEMRAAIDKAVASAPVVLFMKGTPEAPQCGFSRASIQILGLQGVDPKKFAAFNVLEDPELRQGMLASCHLLDSRSFTPKLGQAVQDRKSVV